MENLKYIIETWGCQMNEEDSEKLSGSLKKLGYTETNNRENADIIVFNTCAVRENAELKVHGNINLLKQVKDKNKDVILAVCGCMMQQKGVAEEIAKRYPFLDIIFGTHNSYKFPEYLNRVISQNERIIEVYEKETEIVEGIPIDRKSDVKAFVTIMYGCNNFCTYCVVPYVRGRERSRSKEDILKEINDLVSKGYKEITLLGQNVNSYGNDLEDENENFASLLESISNIKDLPRIKFMTSHPKDLSDDVIDIIAKRENICNYIHLPVQSGSNEVLKNMNRKYTREDYLETVRKIKENIKDVSISTDIIVGFPGETEEQFNETLSLVKEADFDMAFMYIYSKRGNTKAEKMDNQVEDSVKHERFSKLVEVVNSVSKNKNEKYLNKVVKVLVEGNSKKNDEKLTGRTAESKTVNFSGNAKIGDIVDVLITVANSFSLIGVEVKEVN